MAVIVVSFLECGIMFNAATASNFAVAVNQAIDYVLNTFFLDIPEDEIIGDISDVIVDWKTKEIWIPLLPDYAFRVTQ